MRDRKIILFELNEVPLRILDEFRRRRPSSALARRWKEMQVHESVTEDPGHLSPWVTWPTLHRGVTVEQHGILNFGQELGAIDREHPPIWQRLAAGGVRVGVGGSLHTHPMPESLEGYAFYLPDTFAAGSECFPESLEAFQDFNLRMARDSARNVSTRVPWDAALRFLAAAPGLGLRPSTAGRLAAQVASERLRPHRRVRRRTSQAELAFDVFSRALVRERPDFSTFFTNHVASSMHRFWAAAYPEDYDEIGYDEEWMATWAGEIDFTMRAADRMLARLFHFVDRNPEWTLVVASSMGQAATTAKPVETQLYATDVARFMAFLGVPSEAWHEQPAMLPQLVVVVSDEHRDAFLERLAGVEIAGAPLAHAVSDGRHVTIDLGHPDLHRGPGTARVDGRETPFIDMGLEATVIEDMTGTSAYHVPAGSLLIHRPELRDAPESARRGGQVSTVEVAPWLLANFGLPVPSSLRPAPAL